MTTQRVVHDSALRELLTGWEWTVIVSAVICIGGLAWHLKRMLGAAYRADRSPARGSPRAGIWYAFTSGMMPWAKESTRRHLVSYLRGVFFHVGIFAALSVLVLHVGHVSLSEGIQRALVALLALGALNGIAGLIMRVYEPQLRRISTPDDYFSVALVTAFEVGACAATLDEGWMAPFFVVSALTLLYIPVSKIRHCIYFFFSRFFFGQFYGRRGVIR